LEFETVLTPWPWWRCGNLCFSFYWTKSLHFI